VTPTPGDRKETKMSAPDHATPIGQGEAQLVDAKTGKPSPWPGAYCEGCGWRGSVAELLGVDPDEDTTLWCPQCGTSGWVYE